MSFADLPEELIIEQLLSLPIEDINRACQINVQFAQLCNNPHLWRQLIMRDLPQINITEEPSSEVYYYYRWLVEENLMDLPIGFLPKAAAVRGELRILEFLAKRGLLPDEDAFYEALRKNHAETALWIMNQSIVLRDPSKYVDHAAQQGHLAILQQLYKQYGVLPSVKAATLASMNGHQDVVNWLNDKGIYVRVNYSLPTI